MQITAPISPGGSGGPLFNMAGEVVGITTLYLKGGENLNFAIPVNDAKLLLSADSKVQDFPSTELEAHKTVSEILDWIQTHFDTITTTSNIVVHSIDTDTFGLSFDNCQVTVTWTMRSFSTDNTPTGSITHVYGPLDLGGLRPEPEEMPVTHEELHGLSMDRMRVYSIKPFQIKETQEYLGWTQKPNIQEGSHNFFFLFTTSGLAERQQKAWYDAILLCGGKKTQDDLY